jgi:hypothetical protein
MEGFPVFLSRLQPSGSPEGIIGDVNLVTGIIPGFAPEVAAHKKDKNIQSKKTELFFI